MRIAVLVPLMALLYLTLSSCRSTDPTTSAVSQDAYYQNPAYQNPAYDQLFLQRAGQNAVGQFYTMLLGSNRVLEDRNEPFRLAIIDANDPRIYQQGLQTQVLTTNQFAQYPYVQNGYANQYGYGNMQGIQYNRNVANAAPNKLIVKAFANGGLAVTGKIVERQGYFELTSLQGEPIFCITYSQSSLRFDDRFPGALAIVSRTRRNRTYDYNYRLRGNGFQTAPIMVDQAVFDLLVHAVSSVH